jgi:succinyl-diaminopimelate desuccinylase
MTMSPVDLTVKLIRFDTINPPGQEEACTRHLERLLSAAGFACSIVPLADGRPNLIARIGGNDRKPPLAFTGHTDTVPLGLKPWSVPTHDGLIRDGKVWGRGSCDMKGGVAAFVVAAIEMAPRLAGTPGVTLYITAGEETGLAGAMKLAERDMKGEAGALVVAEPTSNRPLCGHKGALWLKAITHGVTAHGSMPDQGVNAVYAAARAVGKLETFDFNVARHPIMGGATLNVGSFAGGINVNSVPDRAEIGIDIRTLPGMDHARLREQLASLLGPEVEFATMVDVKGVWTDPDHPWMRELFSISEEIRGIASKVESAPYITDASALTPALGGVPTTILGPGPAHLAHQTDEWCETERIEEAQRIYERLIGNWCALQ